MAHRTLTVVVALLIGGWWPASAQHWPPKRPDVAYVPTPQTVVDAMLRLAQVTSADVVYDLGSGDGRIPVTAALAYGARGFGVDVDPDRIRESNEYARRAGVSDRVQFRRQDVFDTNVSDATVVTLFLLPWMNMQLMPRLQRELRPGARIVSHHFLMGDQWPPDRAQDVGGLMIYLCTGRPPAPQETKSLAPFGPAELTRVLRDVEDQVVRRGAERRPRDDGDLIHTGLREIADAVWKYPAHPIKGCAGERNRVVNGLDRLELAFEDIAVE